MFPTLIFLLLSGVPVAFALIGTAVIFGWYAFGDLDAALYLFASKIDEVASQHVLAAVPLFVFMGSMLERSSIARRLIEATHLWTHRLPGGLALSTIIMCVIFAASTGVIGTTEIVIGLLAIPVMMTHKYNRSLISGTICAGGSLGTIIPPVLMIAAVLGSIVFGFASPTEAAALGALGAFVLALCYRSLNLRVFVDALRNTLKLTGMIMMILLGDNMFTTIFISSGGIDITQRLIDSLAFGPMGTLTLLLGISFLAGLFLDWISIILLFIPVFIPIIDSFGMDSVWFCVLFLLIIQTSYLTPPMAPAIFYLRGIAPKEITLNDMFKGVLPFIAIQLITLVIVLLFPELATWLPDKLLGFR